MTDRQQAILEYIQACHDQGEAPPTIREIMDALGMSSTSVVNYELDALASAGHIKRDRMASRGIRLVGQALDDRPAQATLAETVRVMQVQIADLQAEVGRLRAMAEMTEADWQVMNREAR